MLRNIQNQKPTPFPTLTTERLALRSLEMTDAKEIFFLRSNVEVNRYLDRPASATIKEAEEFIDKIQKAVINNESFYWAIAFKNEPRLIGTICLWNIDKKAARAEVGYELHPDFQGLGLMHEALTKVIEFGFNELTFSVIVAYPDSANSRSVRLLEKNGFKRDKNPAEENDENNGSGKEIKFSLNAADFRN